MLARYKQENEETAFKTYMADGIWLLGNGKMYQKKFSELIHSENEVDNRTGDDIVLEVFTRCGLSFKEE